jgi:lipoprotein-anchoring transpeptidase ErfK/SrfK
MILSSILLTVLLAQDAPPPRPALESGQQPAQTDTRVPDASHHANDAEAAPGGQPDLAALQLQVMLDRAGFSPGVIDGRMGPNTERALVLFQQHRGEAIAEGILPLATYTITEADTAGRFTAVIPADLVAQASLPALGYRSVIEALAERFHTTPELLRQLNPGASFAAGEMIQVPDVEPLVVPVDTVHIEPQGRSVNEADAADRATGTTGTAAAPMPVDAGATDVVFSRPDVVVTVAERESTLTVADADGQVIFSAPVTTGSQHNPLPIGEWTITAIQFNPVFHYDPALFWDADPRHSKSRIQPGPNNPVGLVWIDLDKERYGIHGTPEPAAIGRAQSHGCVRLTNWDAVRLAGLVKPGTRVVFTR